MSVTARIIFFSVFFLIIGLISFYIFIRGRQCIPPETGLRHAYSIVFWIIALSFIGARLLEKMLPVILADILVWIGSFWLAAALYLLLAAVLFDLVRLANHFFPFYPAAVVQNYQRTKFLIGMSVFGVVAAVLLIGHINSIVPRIINLNLRIPRKASKLDRLKIVGVSDIHLGTIVGRSRFDGIVKRMNSLDPDIVLLPGDIVDEDLGPVIRQNLGESLRNIRSKFGVYAITGNHEFIGGVTKACAYLVEHDITMLRDRSIKVADSFFLVGREDRSSDRFSGKPRKELSELMKSVDGNYPVILMDHQPFGLEEAAAERIDLQISGHTHYGQLWPINYIVERIYEIAWGYKKISDTHYYVSDGIGTWGPPVRIGNRPEIMQITLEFK